MIVKVQIPISKIAVSTLDLSTGEQGRDTLVVEGERFTCYNNENLWRREVAKFYRRHKNLDKRRVSVFVESARVETRTVAIDLEKIPKDAWEYVSEGI